MKYFVTFPSGDEKIVDIVHLPTGEAKIEVDGRTLSADAVDLRSGATTMRVDGKAIDLWLEGEPPDVGVVAGGRRFYATVESERMRALAVATQGRGGGKGDGVVTSPMPGRVLKVLVNEGDTVEPGAPLIVVEAMKMENELYAEQAGTVTKVHVTAGTNVEGGAKLIEIRA